MRARQEEGMRGGRDERGLDNTRSEGDQRKGGGSYGNQEGGLGGGGRKERGREVHRKLHFSAALVKGDLLKTMRQRCKRSQPIDAIHIYPLYNFVAGLRSLVTRVGLGVPVSPCHQPKGTW